MNNRAYNNGVVVGAAINHAAAKTVDGLKAAGKGTKTVAISVKDTTKSFWSGLRAGIKAPNAQLGTTVPSEAKIFVPSETIIIVKR